MMAGGFKFGHFDILGMLFPFLAFVVKAIAHNFIKSRSRDGLAAKGLLVRLLYSPFFRTNGKTNN